MTRLTVAAVSFLLVSGGAAYGTEQEVRRAGFEPTGQAEFEIVKQFYDYDSSQQLDPRVVDQYESKTSHTEKVVFSTSTGERVPALLVRPVAGDGPFPCVLLLHGLNDSKSWWWDREDRVGVPDGLVASGFAVFAIDLQYHGERIAHNDYQLAMYLTFGDSLFIKNRNMLIQSTIDSRRALDYLRTRKDIEPDQISLLGYSMGGMIALYLSVLEPWLQSAAACAVPSFVQLTPADHYNFASYSKSVPLALLIGKTDRFSSPQDAKLLLDLIPSSDKRLRLYESGHTLPSEFSLEAITWIRTHNR